MRASPCWCIPLALCALFAASPPASGQSPLAPPPADTSPTPPPVAQAPTDSGGQPGGGGGAAASSKVFNPDIAVIGNFLGAAGTNPIAPLPAMELRESELTFQAVVDPYARADFFLSFSEHGAEVEEGFITFLNLPGGLLMKVGKMRAAFGKLNTQHPHVLPWTDRPLVTENLVGGDEGISDAGMSAAWLVPNPWIFLELTGQVFRGTAGDIFNSTERSDVSLVGHVRAYHDISESTNLDVGASYAGGHNASGIVDDVDVGRYRTDLFGIDATVRWKPLQRSIYHSFITRFEGVMSRRDQPGGRSDATGFYVSGDYQLNRRWFTGVRFDRSERAGEASLVDTGQSLTLTYWPSEFSQIRGQYRRTSYAEDVVANEFLFQFQFSIGAHGAHAF